MPMSVANPVIRNEANLSATSSLPTDVDLLRRYQMLGIQDVFAVPCSITGSWTSHALASDLRGEWRFRPTTHEGNLVGLAAGVYLGTGRTALVHLQNSGLPYLGEGLVSMANPGVSGIPMALLVTHRGADPGDRSEPHQEIGRRTDALLNTLLGDAGQVFDRHHPAGLLAALEGSVTAAQAGAIGVLKLTERAFRHTEPAALAGVASVARHEGAFRSEKPTWLENRTVTRDDALRAIVELHPDAAILCCNGYTSRALRALADRPGNFYNVGYMGGTLAIGWSLARARPDLDVVVVDGDQNALMSTMKDQLWSDYPANLHWYVLDNGVGASVGGAPSLPLPASVREMACVIETLPDAPGSFVYPRVSALGAHFDEVAPGHLAGRLASMTWRFHRWAMRQAVAHPESPHSHSRHLS